jgi:hydrogenase-4 component F
MLIIVAALHTTLTAGCWIVSPPSVLMGWLMLDDVALLFLSITSLLFLISSFYAVGYLRRETEGSRPDFEDQSLFVNAPETRFIACLLFFLSTMTVVILSRHFGLFWVAMEATTLASAPLIYFHRHHRSLEATWKYLMICSVGIAMALLGNFFLVAATIPAEGESVSLVLDQLIQHNNGFQIIWLKAAFIFILVGYGTKMGLAPMHTWLPDAHSESPSVVSALLSGALLNCAFLGILRTHQLCVAAGIQRFSQDLLLGFGLFSMAVAAVFILGQRDYKRMLAYSSIEHMGILALGIGLGGEGIFGAMFHAVNHSLTKGLLFLTAGNILAVYHTKSTSDVRGILKILPLSGILWITGFLAIVGSPPFGTFLSEFTILKAAIDQQQIGVAVVYLALLSLIFIGMADIFLRTALGRQSIESDNDTVREHALMVVPPFCLAVIVLCLGIYLPSAFSRLLHDAAQILGGI